MVTKYNPIVLTKISSGAILTSYMSPLEMTEWKQRAIQAIAADAIRSAEARPNWADDIGINCNTLPYVEAGAQQQLGLARGNLDHDPTTFLFFSGTNTNAARERLERAAEYLNGQGDFPQRIGGIGDSLPTSDNLLVYEGQTVDRETFEAQEQQIEALRKDVKKALMECVEGVPLGERVDQYAAAKRLEGAVSTICITAIVVPIVGFHLFRGLFYSGIHSKPRTK